MTTVEAIQMVVADRECPALNYTVEYAQYALTLPPGSEKFRVQCLYVVGNLGNWRAGKTSKFTAEQIRAARLAIFTAGNK